MEGAAATVGSLNRWVLLAFLAALPGIVPGNAQPAGASVTFLVIERPGNLVIYNEYQQTLSAKDRGALIPYVPMQVVSSRTLLGDGITGCMKVEIGGSAYFLLLEDEGRLAGESRAGTLRSYSGAQPVTDTVVVMRGGSLEFESAGTTAAAFLPAGERLKQCFRHAARTYVLRLTSQPVYGWVTLKEGDENRLWKIDRGIPIAGSIISGGVRDSVAARVAGVNNIIARLFDYFNRSATRPQPVPHWTVESTESAITCVFETAGSPEAYRESTHFFARELESLVLGSGLEVLASSGKIVIRPK